MSRALRVLVLSTAVLPVCAALLSPPVMAADEWWDPAWEWRRQIDINTDLLTEDLVDFPLSLYIHDNWHLYNNAKTQVEPLSVRVVDSAGTALHSKNLFWKGERGEIHVSVPRIAAGQGVQRLYLYYGNPAAEAMGRGENLWQNGYVAVSHFAKSANWSRAGGVPLSEEGELPPESPEEDGRALPGDKPAFFSVQPKLLEGLGEQMTMAVRFKFEDDPGLQNLASGLKKDGPEEWFNFGLKTPNTLHTNATSNGQRAPELNIQGLEPGRWHGAVVRYDARNHTRTLCLDGVEFALDSALPGPLRVNEMRVGRGVLHFEPWQLHGRLMEFRLSDVARSDSWVRAEAACLAERNPFVALGPVQHHGEPAPVPQPFALMSPNDGLVHRKRAALELRWYPSAGAEQYSIFLYDGPDDPEPFLVLDAAARTRFELDPSRVPKKAFHWTVVAQAASGGQAAEGRRSLAFYDWVAAGPATPPADTIAPALQPARDAQYDLKGYLRGRIDRAIHRYYIETPESSPAMLQVLRDRDKRPVRDPLVPWAGEFAGKYLTGAQLAWRLTRDADLKTTVDQFVRDLIACQAENGYLGPFPPESRLTGGNWDEWGHYHCMLGLMLYYEDTGYAPALEACTKAADLLFETFGPGGPTLTNDGSGGEMNMSVCHALVLLYKKTGVMRYLELAQYIVHEAWNEESAGHYLENALAGKPLIEFQRHRWESMHDWMALTELYWLTGDEQYRKAFEHIWRSARDGDRHNTGGITSGEGFTGSPYRTEAIETCCTVAWIAMSLEMLRLTGDPSVADEIEWSTLNSALGAIPYSGRACAYNVPMDGTRVFGVELPWQSPKAGPDLNCCAVNANRPLGMISQWALMQDSQGLVLNFYGPGAYSAALSSGNRVALTQETTYPANGKVHILVSPERPETFILKFRVPGWSKTTTLRINGEEQPAPAAGAYAVLQRAWNTGDTIDVAFDFTPRFWQGQENFAGKASVYRGPLLFAFDARYSDLNPDQLPVLDPAALSFQEAIPNSEEAITPWLRGTLIDASGAAIPVVDFSSAGQTGNHYRSWLPVKGALM